MGKNDLLYHWDEDAEILLGSADDAVLDFIESSHPDPDIRGNTVHIYCFKRMVCDFESFFDLERILESADDEFMAQELTEPTDKMKEAAKAFVDAMNLEYVPWGCERFPEGDKIYDLIKKVFV